MRTLARLTLLTLVLLPALALLTRGQAAAQTGERCFPETGFCISGRIREFWEQNGGLPVFGFPISSQGPFQAQDGRTVQAQWFERQRLELHPENARPYDVLLGRLGVDRLNQQGRNWFTFPKATPEGASQAGCVFVAQTQHSVCEPFRSYYQRYGIEFDGRPGFSIEESLALFGLPISEAAPEVGPDGRERVTQWFERARLEFHPEQPAQFSVLGGLLGREVFDASLAPPAPQPSPTPAPPAATPSPTPIPGAGPDGCTLAMTFVRDVAVPNGSTLDPFAAFERIWRVRNDGTCAWSGYQVVFARGDQMSAPAAVRIPAAQPGQSIDISVPMIAPGAPGDYRSSWVLRATNGATFGGLIAQITVRSAPSPTPLPDAGALANTNWDVTRLYVNQVPLPDTLLTIVFQGGTALGTTGCNTFRGPYSVSGSSITIGPLATTRASCDDARNAQEATFLQALAAAATWRVDGGTLILFDAGGSEVARFAARP